ncbi:hypothetical protein [Streptomyces sp. P3]|uniref:hypothetical protein n=1 Tax=Streptomyces sp. P3 TaxID=2135430 RepID=UPI0020B14898|nr:hypothetical protein [Streptomyces sp. P3]
MLVAVDPSAERAEKHTRWKSEGSQHYEARLTEGRKLLAQLAEGYDKAAGALRGYAFVLQVAKAHYSNSKANEQSLADLIHTKGTVITRDAHEAEPMRQWEDMAESEFADVPAEEMTPAQYQELAARYDGGPYWRTEDAQAYGRGFANDLTDARNALR